jgi:hypothetical protein
VPHVSLTNFRLDHLDIEARTAGTIANAKNWTTTDNSIKTADGRKCNSPTAHRQHYRSQQEGRPLRRTKIILRLIVWARE